MAGVVKKVVVALVVLAVLVVAWIWGTHRLRFRQTRSAKGEIGNLRQLQSRIKTQLEKTVPAAKVENPAEKSAAANP